MINQIIEIIQELKVHIKNTKAIKYYVKGLGILDSGTLKESGNSLEWLEFDKYLKKLEANLILLKKHTDEMIFKRIKSW